MNVSGRFVSSLLKSLKGLGGAGRGSRRAAPSGRAARLAAMAGLSHGVEQLEQRQLLFTLTIGPGDVDPATGLGTRTADFEYYIPYLFRTIPDPTDGTNLTENFDDEMAGWTQGVPPVPPSGTVLEGSEIQISYRSATTAPLQLLRRPVANGQPNQALFTRLAGTDQVTFTFQNQVSGDDAPPTRYATRARISISSTTFPLSSDGDGLKTDPNTGSRLELLQEGRVVATFTGAALAALGEQIVVQGVAATRYTVSFVDGFDAIRLASAADEPNNATYADNFTIEAIEADFPSTRFQDFVKQGIFGATVTITGPVGSSIQLLDVYGRDMQQRTGLRPQQGFSPIDPVGSGRPQFNDGIGRVIVRGTNAQSSFTLVGYDAAPTQTGLPYFEGPGRGIQALDTAGLGFAFEEQGTGVEGLPQVGGSVVIGSPYVRSQQSPAAYLGQQSVPTTDARFNDPNQGIFVEGSIGSIYADALVFGSSRIDGAAARVSVGALYGSLRIDGDLGTLTVQSDAGVWYNPPGSAPGTPPDQNDPVNPTGSRINIGRTARSIDIGARNAASVSVLADVNNPSRARLQQRDYFSKETVQGFNVQQDGTKLTVTGAINRGADWSGRFTGNGQPAALGTGWYRNDTLGSAEFVGHFGTNVRIIGNLNGSDPVNTAIDGTDVYAFPADPSREIVVGVNANFNFGSGLFNFLARYARVVDVDGRVIAALDQGSAGRGAGNNNSVSNVLRFRVPRAGVYYLVLNVDNLSGPAVGGQYAIEMTGLAPVTFGSFRTGSGMGDGGTTPTINLSAGSMGHFSIGSGFATSSGGVSNALDITGTTLARSEQYLRYWGSTLSVPENLYGATFGTDINGGQIIVGGDLGTLVTGTSETEGRNVLNGDLINADIRVGGDIALLDIKGGLAVDQVPNAADGGGTVTIQTGLGSGRRGDIGQILVGAYTNGTGVTIRAGQNAQIDQVIIGADNGGAGSEFPGWVRGNPMTITTGVGSDVRFMDFSLIQTNDSASAFRTVNFGESFEYRDDAGADIVISLAGGNAPAAGQPDPRAGSFLRVYTMGINGSVGGVVARIEATLLGGASLFINGQDPGVASIGRIIVLNATSGGDGGTAPGTPAPFPQIVISGTTEIDVGRIDQVGGQLDAITNSTVGGDIVAISALSLKAVNIAGNLGLTQTTGIGADKIGPFLGVTIGTGGGQGLDEPIPLNGNAMNILGIAGWFSGGLYVPIQGGGANTIEHQGSPVDPYLDGVIVRSGDLRAVTVAGSVGDVLVPAGHLVSLTANSDNITPQGAYHGIVGNVYALAIGDVEVGSGLRGSGPSPFAEASISSVTGIVSVVGGTRLAGTVIEGIIVAAGIGAPITQIGIEQPRDLGFALDGIGTVRLTNGRYDGAYIAGRQLHDFWVSIRGVGTDEGAYASDVLTVQGVASDLFRSTVSGFLIRDVTLNGNSAFDATFVQSSTSIGTVTADEFRNSTRLGQPEEFFRSRIAAVLDVGSIFTNGLAGDISDLTVDLNGSLTGQIAGRNLDRLDLSINNVTAAVRAANDVRSTTVRSGRLGTFDAGRNIRSVSLIIAGPIQSVTAASEITGLDVVSSGPDGRVDLIRAQNLLDADVSSSGNIGSVESVTNDVVGRFETRNDVLRANNGGLTSLRAGRDLKVALSILGNTQTIFAARNIGAANTVNPDLDLRGNLGNITAQTGQIYSDLLVGQSITGTVTTGRVFMLPGNDQVARADIVAFGRINAIVLNSDFVGDIVSRSGGIGSITFNSSALRPGSNIIANGGNLTQLTFNGGDLLGNVLVDGNIGAIDVLNGPDGFKGQIGIASWRRNFRPVPGDQFRNQLPPEVARTEGVDGVLIRAGGDIGRVFVQQGSFTESRIVAGGTISSVDVALQLRNDALTTGLNNAIVAGDRIEFVRIGGFVGAVAVLSGVVDLGADQRVGGTGADADTVGSGTIGRVLFPGRKIVNSVISAGIAPNDAGRYNRSDSKAATGRSAIGEVFAGGTVINTSAFSSGELGATSPGIVRGGSGLAPVELGTVAPASGVPGEVELVNGVSFQFQLPSGERGRVTLSGPGRAFYSATEGQIRLLNTTESSSLVITANGQNLTSLRVLGNVLAALGSISVTGNLRGNSSVFINGNVGTFALDRVDSAGGLFGSGGNIGTLTTSTFLGGTLRGKTVGSFRVNGDFGRSSIDNDALAQFFSVGDVSVTGVLAGGISSDRTIPSVTTGSVNNGGVRSGESISSFVSGPTTLARLSARNSITSVTITGDAVETSILAGADLGADADFGGSGRDADVVGAGSIGTVNVSGNFRKSDVAAGVLPGPSGYIGNADLVTSAGRSQVGTVTIGGTQVGSNLNSEQYRVISTGSVGSVRVGGQEFTGVTGNFRVERLAAVAVPVRVLDLQVSETSRQYSVSIVFNQSIDLSTLSSALSVLEVRNSGLTTIGLAEGSDYTLRYDRSLNTVIVTFSRTVTERNLPSSSGVPGPGVYQIVLSGNVLRGSTFETRLDGNGDGQAGDDFARNVVVGDAGDKINPGKPTAAPTVDFYGAIDLDLVLRQSANIGSLPDINQAFTLRGSIGDHPDTDPDVFRLGGDVDVYRVSLRAGQILRLGQITGTGLNAARGLYNAAGQLLASNTTGANPGGAVVSLPANVVIGGGTAESQILINQTGTYFIVVAGSLDSVDISDVNVVTNRDPVPGAFGQYSFSITVIDDGNTGFLGDTNSGTGAPIVYPPVPRVFAGTDGIFGNGDDLREFVSGDWIFTLTPGAGGPVSSGSVVNGRNSQGWTISRSSAPNGTFGSVNDRISGSITSSIGLGGAAGLPNEVAPDVDVFVLNNGQPIAPGTKIRATVRLSETGSNIGLTPEIDNVRVPAGISLGQNLLGQSQFSLFELPSGTGFGDARMVAGTNEFLPIGNQPSRTVSDGRNSYGYDERGDFFMDIVIPGALGVSNPVPAVYALYIQGAIRSDYTIEFTQQGTGSTTPTSQNVLLESLGGIIDWLEAGDGVTTRLDAFTTSVVGFSGQVNGVSVDEYVLTSLVSNLRSLFTAAGVQVNISTNPNDFARQSFSTVFLAGNVEPTAFFGDGVYGASQKVDLFNADKNDQAVVFISSLSELGFDPSVNGVNGFVGSLTAAVGRRIGELLGVHMETVVSSAALPVPIMADNSPTTFATNANYRFNDQLRPLSGLADPAAIDVFYLGFQNAGSLIRRVVAST